MCLFTSPLCRIPGLTGLNEGQRVSYELAEQRNGKVAAVNLTLVD